MKVALAQEFLVKLGGAERVLKSLSDLFPEAPIFTLFYDEKAVGKVFPKGKIRGLPLQKMYDRVGKKQKFLLPFMATAIEKLDFHEYDLVISSNTALMHGIVTDTGTKHICYCHSPARYLWDYYHQYKKEQHLTGLQDKLATKLLHDLRMWDRTAVSRVDTWIANSRNVQKRILKYYRKPSYLIYPPVDVHRFQMGKTHENYFLIVSTLTSYKRIDLAIQLFNRLGRKLVIIGEGSQREYLESIAENNIEFLGYQSDQMVTEYMKHARAFLFLGEDDFGIAPVEAMACGKPIIAYGKGGALETVIPHVTGELFSDQSVDGLEKAMVQFFLHEKNYSPLAIRKHALQFDQKVFQENMKKLVMRG
jgi:glycosyltransferase involved in cell wall biosynthesis